MSAKSPIRSFDPPARRWTEQPVFEEVSDDRYFNLAGLARYSGISVSSLRRYMADPEHPLPHHHIAPAGKQRGRVLVFKREFDAWVRSFADRRARPDASSDLDDASWIVE